MENAIRSKISEFGGIAAFFGLASITLSFFEYNLRVLAWIDYWGATIGWVIRISLVVVGLAIYFLMNTLTEEELITDSEIE